MDGDVAAVVDESALQPPPREHRLQHRVGDGAGDGGHRRDEHTPMPLRRGDHPPGHRPPHSELRGPDRPAQDGQVADEDVEERCKIAHGLRVRRLDFARDPPSLDDQIDRAVLQVQPPAVRQHARGGAHLPRLHGKLPAASGQGLPGAHGTALTSAAASPAPEISARRTTRSMWPPSAS